MLRCLSHEPCHDWDSLLEYMLILFPSASTGRWFVCSNIIDYDSTLECKDRSCSVAARTLLVLPSLGGDSDLD
mgnify:CR=1 FL=1